MSPFECQVLYGALLGYWSTDLPICPVSTCSTQRSTYMCICVAAELDVLCDRLSCPPLLVSTGRKRCQACSGDMRELRRHTRLSISGVPAARHLGGRGPRSPSACTA